MNALMLVDVVEEMTKALVGLVKVGLVMERNFFFFDGTHEALSRAMLRGVADGGHTDLDTEGPQRLDIGRSRILDALVRVMNVGSLLDQRASQGRHRERLVEMTAQMPAPNGPGIDIHQHSHVHKLLAPTHRRDIPNPEVIRADHRDALHQVGITSVAMVAVCCPGAARRAVPL